MRKAVKLLIDAQQIASAVGVPCIVSARMQTAMQLWESLYRNEASWQKDRVRPLRLPSVIAKELKRLVLKEFASSVNDAQIHVAFQQLTAILRRKLDSGLSMGGLLFKPYWVNGQLLTDIVPQNQYLPMNYTNNSCDAVACPETIVIGKTSYTRIETHVFDRTMQTHTITNQCFRSDSPGFIGRECSLKEVPAWADMTPEKIFNHVRQPLFSVFQMPDANSIDPDSPLGISAFADAVDFIRDADIHWERILWELESSERAIDASESLFRMKNGKPVLPKGRERMFRTFTGNPNTEKSFFTAFSPEIRDASYFHAWNQMLRRIESACGLSYGFLSEVEDVEKTAEEIKSSKQRSFDRIHDIQESLRTALEGSVYGLQYLRDYYENRSQGNAVLTCTFGDGVLEDTDKEFNRRMQMVTAGILSKEQFLMWYFSCDEADVNKYLPKMQSLFGGQHADSITI